jgi:hypothetical protein
MRPVRKPIAGPLRGINGLLKIPVHQGFSLRSFGAFDRPFAQIFYLFRKHLENRGGGGKSARLLDEFLDFRRDNKDL